MGESPAKIKLLLEDGSSLEGTSFGAASALRGGEVVFNTAMTGYVETLTDPSYRGQILVTTYPLIGNYGVPAPREAGSIAAPYESDRIQVQGLVVQNYVDGYSHHQAARSLHEWLASEGVPAITGIDTRTLTRKLREHGTMKGWIVPASMDDAKARQSAEVVEMQSSVFRLVAPEQPVVHEGGRLRILLVDVGAKDNIVRSLLARGVTVIRAPWHARIVELAEQADGVMIGNGPGDPKDLAPLIEQVRILIANYEKPIFGICLGNQILALAAGGDTYKLPYGHRGVNQPVQDLLTRRSYITSQNHGYAVRDDSLPPEWEPWFVNINDGTNEGIRSRLKPFFSVQFHPEATPGPKDASFLFDDFLRLVGAYSRGKKLMFGAYLPKKPKRVLVLGSGALQIGQAGEFDYSGSQAIKAFKEEGIATVLVNPNIATIQTSEGLADKIYLCPVTPDFVEKVLVEEEVDAVALSFGGQTALNCGLELADAGVFEKYGVRVLGTPIKAIRDTEDRRLFIDRLAEIGVLTAKSTACTSVEEARRAALAIGLPVMLRGGFALGGKGSGIVETEADLDEAIRRGFSGGVRQVLVEECLRGWKEIEYEVVRDARDNCITVCNMENLDPMGIHTGESIVVAPSQTLNDEEYQLLRSIAQKTVRHLGIVGECNIQYALDPKSTAYRVIEVNARLSRSSALASKATGYPLAYVAAKIALGHALPEIPNAITRCTTAFFEPALDYLVCKVPRWDLAKFRGASMRIGSEMKSVGEVMAIGRTFPEVIQKALRMLDIGVHGLDPEAFPFEDLDDELKNATPLRIFAVAKALSKGMSVERVHELTRIDPWFLNAILPIVRMQDALSKTQQLPSVERLGEAKRLGFSDRMIGRLTNAPRGSVRELRKAHGIAPHLAQIDTMAAEFPAETNYLYSSYHARATDVAPSWRKKVMVLGSGSYRIGSSVEFDWCCVNAIRTASELGYETIMLNYNPETVSTDYDECDKLVFDEISIESVLDVYEREKPEGIIVSMGGQVPNNLAKRLADAGVKILGTSSEDIDRAEDRSKFSALLDSLGVDQPSWRHAPSAERAVEIVNELGGFPVLVRPSYVLSGAAMSVAHEPNELGRILARAKAVSREHPVVISKFETHAREVEIDAVADHGELVLWAISEHVEDAGVHSGDATLVLPPQTLYMATIRKVRQIAATLARALSITGPFNVQFLAKNNKVMVIECNLRASRSFPFVSKVTGNNFVAEATRRMLGDKTSGIENRGLELDYVAVKAPMFSFSRLVGADPMLGVEMASTGEVGCFGEDVHEALLHALLSTGFRVPKKGVLLSLGPLEDKYGFADEARVIVDELGLPIFATPGTADALASLGIPCTSLGKGPDEAAARAIDEGKVDLVINVPREYDALGRPDGYWIRRCAVDSNIPLITDRKLARALIAALREKRGVALRTLAYESYLSRTRSPRA